MNQIRYLSLMVLMLCGITMWGETSAIARTQADKTMLTVVADPPEGGSVSGGGSYVAGTSVQLRASAATGFQFVSWTRDGEVVSTTASFKYTKGDGDETLVAHFIYNPSNPKEPVQPDIKKKYVLNLLTEEGGYSLNGAGTYAEGTKVSVSVGTNSGFVFLGWYDSSGTLVSDRTSFSYVVTGNETLTARFRYDPSNPSEPVQPDIKQRFVLTLLTEEGGYSVSGAGTYLDGTEVSISVYTETGYSFAGWYDSQGVLVSDKTSFRYKMTGHTTLTARFKYTPASPGEPSQPDIKEHHRITVTAVPSDGGTASVDNTSVLEGDRTRVRAYANSGFVFLGWFSADTLFQTSADFYYTMGKKDIALEARFQYNPSSPSEPSVPDNRKYSIYLTSVRGLPGRTVQYPVYLSSLDSLTNMQFNITFPKGLTPDVENVKLSGKAQDYTLTWQEVAVTTDEASGAPRRAADRETAYQFTLTGGRLPACNTRLMTIDVAISEDADTTQQVKINQVTVTDTEGANTTASTRNGNVVMTESSGDGTYYYLTLISTGSGQASVNSRAVRNSLHIFDLLEGSSTNVYFTPDNGYHIEKVLLDEVDITEQVRQNSRYLFSNVNADATLTVQFAEGASNAYDLTVKATGQGVVNYNGVVVRDGEQEFSVSHGAQVELTITPDNGCRIAKVLLNDTTDVTAYAADSLYVIESMTSANSISVTFEQNPKVENVELVQNGNRISMSTATEGAVIHYTQTGVEGEQTYTETLTLTEDCTLKAWATREGYTNSDTTQLVFVKADVTVATPVLARNNNKVGISCSTEQAVIHYTMDGSDPTAASQVYADSIVVNQNCTIKAIALRENWFDSDVDSLIVDLFKVQNVIFAQNGNRLSMSTATEGAVIHYTQTGVDGEQTYTETLTLTDDCTLRAWATLEGYNTSDTTQLAFVKADVTVATPVLARHNNKVGISCSTEQAVIHYTMDGSEPTAASQVYADSIVVSQNCTIKAIALRENWFDSAVDSLVVDLFKVQNVVFAQDGNRVSMSTATDNATIHYTQTGVEGEQTYTETLTLTEDCEIQAWATLDGYNNSDTLQHVFVKADVTVATPVLARNNNKVGISCSTEQAVIHYTMDGSEPTAASQVYADSIVVSQNCTIKAIALRENWFDSAVDSLVVDLFKVQNVVFAQDGNRVSMSTATENATIHYTQTGVDGEQTYTAPLNLTGDCTIEAWATLEGYTNSDTTRYEFIYTPVGEALFDGQVAIVTGERTLDDAFESVGGRAEAAKTITAIIWEKETALTEADLQGLDNPNLLLFVNSKEQAASNMRNLVVNGEAQNITLTDNGSGNCDFYSPREFTVKHIQYTREFRQQTQIGVSRGWESIALPFTVQAITHERQGVIAPFGIDGSGKHFWLRMLSPTGLTRATQIEANRPYVISMPNSDEYKGDDYYLNGRVTFAADDAVVPATTLRATALADSSIVMMPALQQKDRSSEVWALNVGQVRGQYLEGSVFERDYREVRPFEAYTVHRGTTAPRFLPILEIEDGNLTGIEVVDSGRQEPDVWYSLDGRKLQQKPSRKGVYILNGRKVALKFVK